MIKVLFMIHDLSVGGAEKVLVNLVNNMDRNKFDVTIMSLFDVGVNKQFLKSDVKYISCFKHAIPGNSHYLKLLTPRQLYKWLVKDNYDIVVSYLEGPTARIAGGAPDDVKVVSWIHCTMTNKKELSIGFRNSDEACACFKRSDKMVFVSDGVKQAFQAICATNNNSILYNTNDTDEISTKSIESLPLNFDTQIFSICSVGKLTSGKGIERLLHIVRKLKTNGYKLKLNLLGNGDEENKLKQLTIKLNIADSVTFWGYQTNPYKFVANCDLYVCASYAEGFSTAATEALIVGTPVCTVDVSGMKEMLGHNNEYGIVVENDDEQLYNAIKALIDDPLLLNHYKTMAKERGKSFSTENTVRAVEDMLCSLV